MFLVDKTPQTTIMDYKLYLIQCNEASKRKKSGLILTKQEEWYQWQTTKQIWHG